MLSKAKQKYIIQLHQKKFREREGLFIAEGKKIVEEILLSEIPIQVLYASEDFLLEHQQLISDKKTISEPITQEELRKISSLKEPDDALAVCKIPQPELIIPDKMNHLILYLDEIRDPGNMGTIIRICDWFNVPMIICSTGTVDVYNSKTIQASMGSFIRVPVFYKSLNDTIELFRKKTETEIPMVYGAYADSNNIYKKNNFLPGLLVIGNEANGISHANESLINEKISIPKFKNDGPESLNAAVAASLIIGEFTRRK